MIEAIYKTLNGLGYTHPLHPTLTHVVMGLVIGGFVFALVAWVFNRPALAQSGGHCMTLALIFLFPTAALGYADWQHFYGGAWIFPIGIKLVLAVVLLVFSFWPLGSTAGRKQLSGKTIAVYGLGPLDRCHHGILWRGVGLGKEDDRRDPWAKTWCSKGPRFSSKIALPATFPTGGRPRSAPGSKTF